jgi:hypothetical protein
MRKRTFPLSFWPLIMWVPFVLLFESMFEYYPGMPKRLFRDSITELSAIIPPLITILVAFREIRGWRSQSRVFVTASATAMFIALCILALVVWHWYVLVWRDPNGKWGV